MDGRIRGTWVLILLALPGCTSLRLQHSITKQSTTIADMHYQQVMNNLALFSVVPDALPSHAQIKEGSAQIQDFGQLALASAFAGSVGYLSNGSPTLTGSRTVVQQWGITPVTDDVEMRILKIAYQMAVGLPAAIDLDLANDIARELSKQTTETGDIDQRNESLSTSRFREKFAELNAEATYHAVARLPVKDKTNKYVDAVTLNQIMDLEALDNIVSTNSDEIILKEELLVDPTLQLTFDAVSFRRPNGGLVFFTPLAQASRREVKDVLKDLVAITPGWFHVGSKRDVPKNACYVGKYKDRYAWVNPDGMAALTQFTLTTIKFADIIKERTVLTVPGGPRFTPSAGR
jgi:hypothetical protein